MTSRKPPAPKQPNQPEHEPTPQTRAQVEKLASLGIKQEDIAVVMSLGKTALKKHYRVELTKGVVLSKVAILQSGYRMSVGAQAEYDDQGRLLRAEVKPDRSVVIFMMKARCGLRETTAHEHSGPGGKPIQSEAKIKVVIAPEDEAV